MCKTSSARAKAWDFSSSSNWVLLKINHYMEVTTPGIQVGEVFSCVPHGSEVGRLPARARMELVPLSRVRVRLWAGSCSHHLGWRSDHSPWPPPPPRDTGTFSVIHLLRLNGLRLPLQHVVRFSVFIVRLQSSRSCPCVSSSLPLYWTKKSCPRTAQLLVETLLTKNNR